MKIKTVQEKEEGWVCMRLTYQDACDVTAGSEASKLKRPVVMKDQLLFQKEQVQPMIIILRDDHDISTRVAPGQEVGMVFLDGEEDNWAMLRKETRDWLRGGLV